MDEIESNNHIYVIFGASGDLTERKLIPALFNIYSKNQTPEKFAILGASRTKMSDDEFGEKMMEAVRNTTGTTKEDLLQEFVKKIFYQPIKTSNDSSLSSLKKRIESLRGECGIGGNTIFYLSTPPSLYSVLPKLLASQNLNIESDGWKRLVIEKPFGYDLKSAKKLQSELLKDWNEAQIYRIDHYLGKETVQNILVTRFSNGIFEPLWNRNFVHHVEITSSEEIGVEKRGGYYESSGALRDMVQNHLLQVAGLIAMEPPSSLEASELRDEILKVFRALRPIKKEEIAKNVIRGQYLSSKIKDKKINGYREEKGVDPESMTETYVALKFYIDNWRWGGIPFYIRSGKRLPARMTEAVIHFKPTPHYLFSQQEICDSCNQFILRIQPDEGILLKFGMKEPGAGFKVKNVNMDFYYQDLSGDHISPAYERLILDTMNGDKTLFTKVGEVMEAWKFLQPVINAWKNDNDIPLYGYPAGTWGPTQADELIEDPEMIWRCPSEKLTGDNEFYEL